MQGQMKKISTGCDFLLYKCFIYLFKIIFIFVNDTIVIFMCICVYVWIIYKLYLNNSEKYNYVPYCKHYNLDSVLLLCYPHNVNYWQVLTFDWLFLLLEISLKHTFLILQIVGVKNVLL